MNSSNLFSYVFLFFLTFFQSHVNSFKIDPHDDRFASCGPFNCGKFNEISYPFRQNNQPDYCGHPGFVLDCQTKDAHLLFDEMSQRLRVLELNPGARFLKLARTDVSESTCPQTFSNTTLDSTPFNYTTNDRMATLLFDCQKTEHPDFISFSCGENGASLSGYLVLGADVGSGVPVPDWPTCSHRVLVPVMEKAVQGLLSDKLDVDEVLKEGFEVQWSSVGEEECWDCIVSGGKCGYNVTVNEFRCFCPDYKAYAGNCSSSANTSNGTTSSHQPVPAESDRVYPAPSDQAARSKSSSPNVTLKIIIGVSAAFAAVGVMSVIFFLYLWRRNRKQYVPSTMLFRNISSEVSSGKDVEKSTYLGVHVFSYEELVEATKNFDSAKELGDGGFGTVYYGELRDGRAVAVKRLYESNCRRVEQFMNEVEILAHLRHKNLVSLYGCTSRQSHELLLVYEYIPNGTVADHLHGERARPGALPWHIRLNIAIETACALSYLHASEIVHRDVKTNNILLDNNFSVKVADFGLSRLFPMHVTHVSTAPQGTPGYVDPEYHQCYQLTSKSDVFSFGVVLMELVSSMPAVDITRHRHDINLSTMAMNRIQNGTLHELVDPCLGFNSDSRVKKMITAVAELAFQCLQHEKDMRPPMVDVLEELKAIQSRDFETEKAEKNDSITDEAVLLNSGPLTLSPDTVTINWSSRNTTPNASG